MSNLDGSFSSSAEDVGSGTRNDRLRVITAGHVGNMEARLGTSGLVLRWTRASRSCLAGAAAPGRRLRFLTVAGVRAGPVQEWHSPCRGSQR